jgi:hypothetical protein
MDDKASLHLLVQKYNADTLAIIMRGIVHSFLLKLMGDGISFYFMDL